MKGGFLARLRGTQRQTSDPPLSPHFWHRISHALGWNRGIVVAATDSQHVVWIGFRCVTCGRLTDAEPVRAYPTDIEHRARRPDDAEFT